MSAHQMARAGEPVDSDGSDEWVLMRTLDIGKSYHWNRRTRSSSWSPPEGITVVWVVKGYTCQYVYTLRCLLGDGLRGEGLGIPSPLLGCHQVRGAHRAPVMDVPVILQLKFLPQFPFLDRVLQPPVVLQRRVRAVQTVQKLELPPCSSSTLFTCPLLCVDRCRRWSRQCRNS